MILVDTSIWIDHFRSEDFVLHDLLQRARVLTHPFVLGELALVSMRDREVVFEMFEDLKSAAVAEEPEVLHFIKVQSLHGAGIGYVDAHLLAAVQLTPGSSLWTRDRRLRAVADPLSLSARLAH